jgi:hypothetical protein
MIPITFNPIMDRSEGVTWGFIPYELDPVVWKFHTIPGQALEGLCGIICSELCSESCSVLCSVIFFVLYSVLCSVLSSVLCSVLCSALCSVLVFVHQVNTIIDFCSWISCSRYIQVLSWSRSLSSMKSLE